MRVQHKIMICIKKIKRTHSPNERLNFEMLNHKHMKRETFFNLDLKIFTFGADFISAGSLFQLF